MKNVLLASTILIGVGSANAQSLQSGSIGGMPYYLLPASGGCSAATPCSVATYLSYMGETQANTASDVQNYFGGSFAQQNPHTVVIAPMITQQQSSDVNWGGYNSLTTPQQQQMVAVVQGVEQQMGNTINAADSVVTGGSLGGNGTQAALIAYGPKGTVQPGVFSAGVSFDAATYAAAGNAQDTAALCGVPLMAVHGTADTNQLVTYDQNLASAINGNPACGNSFNFVPVQGAGHGTWGSGLSAGTGPGTALGFLASQMSTGGTAAPGTTTIAAAAGSAPSAAPAAAAAAPGGATADVGQTPTSTTITPGQGSATDCSGNTWSINANTKILENGMPVVGGGDTAQLTVQGCTVYGLSNGKNGSSTNWFTMGSADPASADGWTVSTAPSGGSTNTRVADAPAQPAPAETGPVPTAPAITCGNGVASGAFHVSGGQIIGPDGRPWIARGINVADNDMGQDGQMTALFPGLNFVRLAIYKYQDPSAYAGFISAMTAKGIVVEIEHHVETNGTTAGGGQGDIASGAWLAQENAFYQAVAAAYKSNPYVWFGTTNEPPGGAAGSLSRWQKSTYDTIRGTGNNNPILLEIMGWPGAWNNAMDPSVYANMTNTIWDTHFYGWVARDSAHPNGYSTDQATVDKALADIIAQVQQTKSADGTMPAIVAEWGPSTTGSSLDANANQVINTVVNAGGSRKWGSAAWHWGKQDCCNNLNNGSSLTAPLGQSVLLMIGVTTQSCTQAEIDANAQNAIKQITGTN